MSYEPFDLEIEDGIAVFAINRPEHLNSLPGPAADAYIRFFTDVNEMDDVRAIIVTGKGKAFCAGADISEGWDKALGFEVSAEPTIENAGKMRDWGGRMALAVYNCRKPVIGAINGFAVGVGATMTTAMDVRIASSEARFSFIFAKRGIVTEACSSWFLPRIVGISQALEWGMSGEMFDAEEALRGGLVKKVVPPSQLLKEAKKIARKFVDQTSPMSVALIRQMMYRNSMMEHPLEAHRVESVAMYVTAKNDGGEGVNAFFEKRQPEYKSKASDMPAFYPWQQEPDI